ncbi:hypothetical protein OKW43_007783 [Paraburkholderia sp. WC7.3g]
MTIGRHHTIPFYKSRSLPLLCSLLRYYSAYLLQFRPMNRGNDAG